MGTKARADITPEIRGGLKRYFKMLEAKGKSVSDIWAKLFEDDPATAMRLAISTMPKESQIDLTTRSIEDFVISTATVQHDISSEDSQLH